MKNHLLTVLPDKKILADHGATIHKALCDAGIFVDAVCNGRGTCGKCRIWVNGKWNLACQTRVTEDLTIRLADFSKVTILQEGDCRFVQPDGSHQYVIAFDIGTTTVVAFLLDGHTGAVLAQESILNPQVSFGADLISRIQAAMDFGLSALQDSILSALATLTRKAAARIDIIPEAITCAALVGNTAMHHLLLGIDPSPLTKPPYRPTLTEALEMPARKMLPISQDATVRVLPNIAGFVGADTVGCMVSIDYGALNELSLMIDIGTNGEMVLGDRKERVACSTAAGPAFEGAKISCGMRGSVGAVDHVWLEDEIVKWHTIGDKDARGLCGSGLLDLVAVLLKLGEIDETGRMEHGEYRLGETSVVLTQKDVREVQLAKGAIRAGIELLAKQLGVEIEEISQVFLAGAFGNYLNPESACAIGMIPQCLLPKIRGVGNAAGVGARLCALSNDEFVYSQKLARETKFVELASIPAFQDTFVDSLSFSEEDYDG